MTDQQFSRLIRRTAWMTAGLTAALIFGIILLAGADWVPGTVIVVAALVGLANQIPAIRTLCSGRTPSR